jgi:hypothetical protein
MGILEFQMQRELEPSHGCQRRYARDLSWRAVINGRVRLSKVRMVEGVKRFSPELQSESFRDRKGFGQGQVGVEKMRSVQ